MTDRFPGYNVLAKRDTPSWNEKTREVIDRRMVMIERSDVLTDAHVATLGAIVQRIVPQPENRAPVNAAAILLEKINEDAGDGYRLSTMPRVQDAWRQALDAIDAEAIKRFDKGFADLGGAQADEILKAVESGEATADEWARLEPQDFWKWRLIPDIVSAYYAHPSAWSAMGFGGPASPRGYVRLRQDRRDPWEAAEVDDGSLLPVDWRNRHAQ